VADTALHTGRSRIRFPVVSLEFFIYIILPATAVVGLTQPLTEMSTRYQEYFLGVQKAGA
jgi:hypothetical protein